MKKTSTVRLKNILLMTSLRCFVVLTILVCILLFMIAEDSRRASQEYASSITASICESLKLIDGNLQSVSRYVSVSPPLASLYQPSIPQSSETMENIFDMVGITVTFSDIIQDMSVVSPRGTVRSFFSNLSTEYIDVLMSEGLYDFSQNSISDFQYFFFPVHESEHDSLFLCLFPLIDTSVKSQQVGRVGTVVLGCKLSSLESLLDIGLSYPYKCALLDASGQEIVSYSSEDFDPDGAPLQVSLDSQAIPLTVELSTYGQISPAATPAIIISFCLLLTFLIFTVVYFSKVLRQSLTHPIERLVQIMPSVTLQRNRACIPPTGVDELDVIVRSINTMVDQLEETSQNAMRIKTRLLESELRNNEAELYALQSQINPHFLFNTLQCIRSLAILSHADDITTISSALSAILRYSIREMQLVTVRGEMNIILQYLKIVDIRYQHRFSYEIDVPDDVQRYACPCMIIQPLVENAVIHGLSAADSNGTIRIIGSVSDGEIHFEIADNGAGISEERLQEIQTRLQLQLFDMLEDQQFGKSFGLFNIQRRIQLQYGEEYGLTIATADGWTRLRLHFPAVTVQKKTI